MPGGQVIPAAESHRPQIGMGGGTYLQHWSPYRERNRLPAAIAVSLLVGALYNLNANSLQMRWHFAYERATWACRRQAPGPPSLVGAAGCGQGQPVCRGEHCWHLLQKDSTGSSLLLIPTLSSKQDKNLWAHSDMWSRVGSQFPRAKGCSDSMSLLCFKDVCWDHTQVRQNQLCKVHWDRNESSSELWLTLQSMVWSVP